MYFTGVCVGTWNRAGYTESCSSGRVSVVSGSSSPWRADLCMRACDREDRALDSPARELGLSSLLLLTGSSSPYLLDHLRNGLNKQQRMFSTQHLLNAHLSFISQKVTQISFLKYFKTIALVRVYILIGIISTI